MSKTPKMPTVKNDCEVILEQLLMRTGWISEELFSKQECIPVGCLPPAYCPYPVVLGGGGVGLMQTPGCRPPWMQPPLMQTPADADSPL